MCSSCQSPLTFFCTFCQLPPPPPPPSLHPSSTAGCLSSISDYVEIKRETEDMCGATGRSCQTSLGTASQQGRTTTASSKGGKGRTVLGLPGSRTVSGLLGNKRHKPTRAVTRRAAQNTIRAGKALHSGRRPKSARCDNGPSSEGRDESEADRGTYSPMAVNICVNEAKTVDRDPNPRPSVPSLAHPVWSLWTVSPNKPTDRWLCAGFESAEQNKCDRCTLKLLWSLRWMTAYSAA